MAKGSPLLVSNNIAVISGFDFVDRLLTPKITISSFMNNKLMDQALLDKLLIL